MMCQLKKTSTPIPTDSSIHRHAARRQGVTVLEVMFAVFVVIVGLLGIASLLTLAGRNANDSNLHTQSQVLGQQWYQSFSSRGLNEFNSLSSSNTGYDWVFNADYTLPAFANPRALSVAKDMAGSPSAGGTGVIAGTNSSPSGSVLTALAIPRIWGHQSFCIDPLFFTDPTVGPRFSTIALARPGNYRPAVFPFYEDGLDPTIDPSAAVVPNPWPDQPRLVRLSLNGTSGLISRKVAEEIFTSVDDIVTTTDFDRSLPASTDPSSIVDADDRPPVRNYTDGTAAKAARDGELSWFATISPRPPVVNFVANGAGGVAAVPRDPAESLSTTTDYQLSVVIIKSRDTQFIDPSGPVPAPGQIEDKPQGERLTWVAPLSGDFVGGAGGRVRLISSVFVDDDVHIGDWVMLGKHFAINPLVPTERYAYVQWYRIIAMEEDAKIGPLSTISPTGTDPFGNGGGQVVWGRDVVLEGPDFNFSNWEHTSGTIVTPTTGTIVNDVVTVVQRDVTVPDP